MANRIQLSSAGTRAQFMVKIRRKNLGRRKFNHEFQVDVGRLNDLAVCFLAVEQMLVPSRQTRNPASGQIISLEPCKHRQRLKIRHRQAMTVDPD
jgi:hypothetical protein